MHTIFQTQINRMLRGDQLVISYSILFGDCLNYGLIAVYDSLVTKGACIKYGGIHKKGRVILEPCLECSMINADYLMTFVIVLST